MVHAAERLGTSARQLYRWAERLGIDPDAFRAGREGDDS
jgi:hypothetical protein